MDARSDLPSHEVTNQPPPRGDRDLWASDPVLRAHAIGANEDVLARYGARRGRLNRSHQSCGCSILAGVGWTRCGFPPDITS